MSYDHLPEVYVNGDGERITAPVYRLLAPQFLDDTYFLDGEELVIELVPNEHMQPLNRAAGERLERWQEVIAKHGGATGLKLEDLVEASYMLRPREGVPEMAHDQFSQAVITLAIKLREKRMGAGAPVTPGVVTHATPRSAPPMPNAAWTDPRTASLSRPGGTVVHQPKGAAGTARRAGKPAMPGTPAPGRAQADA